jgi:dynein heavy chain
MNYGDRSMMRHELIRIVRLSYLLEFIVVESLGRCYIQNINDVLGMIELKDYDENYVQVMKQLKYIEPKKTNEDNENKDGKRP